MAEHNNKFDFQLYVITGANYHPGRPLADVIEQTLIGGADVIQLRDKFSSEQEILEQARVLRELTRRYGVPLIINDYIDIAIMVDADGVHLGQEDLNLAVARRRLGPDRIIGISTHSLEQALAAQAGGADYIGVGPVYPTGTKPGRTAVTTSYVREAADHVKIPFVAIGGITLDNIDTVLEAGATRVCAVSAVVGADDPAAACRAFKARIAAHNGAAAKEKAKAEAEAEAGAAVTAHDLLEAQPAESDLAYLGVKINGKEQWTTAGTIEELIWQHSLEGRRLVVELDGEIVERDAWGRTSLREGSEVELVHFVGGG
ncbi:thiamine phosphate synthase [Paenibacillus kobensis]|uniref:thiamine phosphate synthase n=1 Tax=Paenibacillus kobensis TaxID=59841 RepID=UPI000FD997E9|nr:thiamine phosphate synthase [Paenibacillus kobensis]